MKELFLPYDLSLALKEIGFDEPCMAEYSDRFLFFHEQDDTDGITGPNTYTNSKPNYHKGTAAPLYDQVIEWFIEKHNLFINPKITFDDTHGDWFFYEVFIRTESVRNLKPIYVEGDFDQKIALRTGIERAIKIVKNKKK